MPRRPSVFRDVFDTELGRALTASTAWRLERRAFASLRPASSVWQTTSQYEQSKRDYISGVACSPDGALAAVVSMSGNVQVHEPLDGVESFRLAVRAPGASAAVWAESDKLYIALPGRTHVHRYDLESCSESRPSQVIKLPDTPPGVGPGIGDLVSLSPHILAATTPAGVGYIMDDRLRQSATASVNILPPYGPGGAAPPIAGLGDVIAVGAHGSVFVHDVRRLPPASYHSTRTHTLGSSAQHQSALARVRVIEGPGEFASLHLMSESLGTVAFQLASGHVGCTDLLVGGARVRLERALPGAGASSNGATELQAYGSYARASAVDNRSWWVRRRRGCLAESSAPGGGSLFLAPLVHDAGVRIVSLNGGGRLEACVIETPAAVASVAAMAQYGGCASMVVGYSTLRADYLRSVPIPKRN